MYSGWLQICSFHVSGVIRFLAMERSGTLADKNGAITKRFDFPMNGTRLSTSIILQVTSYNALINFMGFGKGTVFPI